MLFCACRSKKQDERALTDGETEQCKRVNLVARRNKNSKRKEKQKKEGALVPRDDSNGGDPLSTEDKEEEGERSEEMDLEVAAVSAPSGSPGVEKPRPGKGRGRKRRVGPRRRGVRSGSGKKRGRDKKSELCVVSLPLSKVAVKEEEEEEGSGVEASRGAVDPVEAAQLWEVLERQEEERRKKVSTKPPSCLPTPKLQKRKYHDFLQLSSSEEYNETAVPCPQKKRRKEVAATGPKKKVHTYSVCT